MRKLLLASVSGLAFAAAGAASAADMSIPVKAPMLAPPPFSWTGCYAGAHVGWGWGHSTFSDNYGAEGFENVYGKATFAAPSHAIPLYSSLIDSFSNGRSASINSSGAVFGGQLGCDYQFQGNFVIGISGSAAGAAINGTGQDPNSFNARLIDFGRVGSQFGTSSGLLSANTDFLADISGRLGYTWAQTLFYVKGGVAFTHNNYIANTWSGADYTSGGPYHVDTYGAFVANDNVTGGIVGGGLEWALTSNWSVFAEYDHYFFPTKTVNFTANGIGAFGVPLNYSALVNVKQDIDTVKVGVNYRFNFWHL
ncbi:MAG: outer membrane protein [Xanthobacteraceae bacterium]